MHALPAAPERRLHHEREPDAFGFFRRLVRIDWVRSSWDGGRAGMVGGASGSRLVAHQQHGLGWWSDEGQPLLRHAPGEIRVLRQEPVPGVDHRGAAAVGGVQDPPDVQVGLHRRGRTDVIGVVGQLDVQGIAISIGIHRDGWDAHLPAGSHDADGDLAAIGHEDALLAPARHARSIPSALEITPR